MSYEDKQYYVSEDELIPYDGGDEHVNAEYTEYEEIDAPENKAVSLVQEVNLAAQQLNEGISMVQNVAGLYTQCVQLQEHTKQIEAMSRVQLARTVAKYKATEQFLTSTFEERGGVLRQHYKVLDHALASGDKELIIRAMSEISGVVTTSPLKDLEKLCENFDDSLDELMDWD